MPPELARRIAARNGLALPHDLVTPQGRYAWRDFSSFLDCYDRVAAVLRHAADYAELAYDYLARCAREGLIYVEVFNSPDHARSIGLPYAEQIAGLAAGMERAEQEFGIVARTITICLRHLGPDRALAVANEMVATPHPRVTGFGMAGDELRYEPRDFLPAFRLADDAGYACTAHAGEVAGPESVRATLQALPVQRLGHGVRAGEDLRLVAEIARRAIVLEICPGSNIALGLYPDRRRHPLSQLIGAGCRITLNSDDPAFFGTSIGQEYEAAAVELGLSRRVLRGITETAIEAAFVDDGTKQRLRERVRSWQGETDR